MTRDLSLHIDAFVLHNFAVMQLKQKPALINIPDYTVECTYMQ